VIIVRAAKLADIPQLTALLKVLFTIEADFDFDEHKQARGLNLLLNSNKDCILAAALPGENNVLGMCTVQTLISTAEGDRVGMLEDLVVAAGFRNQGIASKLVAEAVHWAEDNGLKRLQLLADKNNARALDFYRRKQGWETTRLIGLRKR
jgi:ribosomal protein S18 acetylase RimI-like enzyme